MSVTSATQPLINTLKQPSSEAWVKQAIANLNIILLDHSHCERKAAGVALNLMFRYPSNTKLVRMLTAIAREELEHFELVNQWLERRGIPLGPLAAPPYGAGMNAQFYRGLMASEARHFGVYWLLADTYFERSLVTHRLEELATVESDLLATLHPEPRIHS